MVTFLVLTAFAWGLACIRGPILHKSQVHGTLLCCPGDQFTDFIDLSVRVAHFGEPNMLSRTDITVPYPYPISSVYVYLLFNHLPRPLAAFLIFVLLSFFIATWQFSVRVKQLAPGHLPQIALWSTFLLGFPLLFLLDRANLEGLIWVLILLGIVAYTRNRMLASAILWSMAASMKIFPGLLFVLFVARRKYGMFVIAIVSTAVLSVLALAGVGPSVRQAALDSAKGAPFVINNYILARTDPQFDHSLFQAIKQVIHGYRYTARNDPAPDRPAFQRALRIYNILIPLGAVVLYWFRLRRMPLLNQFMAYLLLCVLLPYVSGDYTLVHVYLVWGAFLLFLFSDVATARVKIPAAAIYTVLFSCAVIFVPLTYLEISHTAGHRFSFGGQVKTVFLLLVLGTVLKVPMPSSLFGDLESPEQIEAEV